MEALAEILDLQKKVSNEISDHRAYVDKAFGQCLQHNMEGLDKLAANIHHFDRTNEVTRREFKAAVEKESKSWEMEKKILKACLDAVFKDTELFKKLSDKSQSKRSARPPVSTLGCPRRLRGSGAAGHAAFSF